MITVILESPGGELLARCSMVGNERCLFREGETFPLLSELDGASYDLFGSSQMSGLVQELTLIREETEAARRHIDELIQLALRCGKQDGACLSFTPFGE